MLYVLSLCHAISPVDRPGLRRVSYRIKLWVKRDELEKKIGLLKERVNQCYLQFTVNIFPYLKKSKFTSDLGIRCC